jgi:hypothetical protein
MVYVKCVIQLQNPEFSLIHPFDNYATNESLLGPEALFLCIVNLSSWFTRARLLDRGIISQLLRDCKRCIRKASFLFATLLVTFLQAPPAPHRFQSTNSPWQDCWWVSVSILFHWVFICELLSAGSKVPNNLYIYMCKGGFPVLARSSSLRVLTSN